MKSLVSILKRRGVIPAVASNKELFEILDSVAEYLREIEYDYTQKQQVISSIRESTAGTIVFRFAIFSVLDHRKKAIAEAREKVYCL